jgi:hypothetical protein
VLAALDRVVAIEDDLSSLETDTASLDLTLTALEEVATNGPAVSCTLAGGTTGPLAWQDGGTISTIGTGGAVVLTQTVYAVVDTSAYGFGAGGHFVPAYIPSLQYAATSEVSVAAGAFIGGQAAVLGATRSEFRYYVTVDSALLGASTLMQVASHTPWSLKWIANAGRCSRAGQARNWEQYGQGQMRIQVDTAIAGFALTPVYVVSLGGDAMHTGYAPATTYGVYRATNSEFYVYLSTGDPSLATPANARAWGWHINWVAVEPDATSQLFRSTTYASGTATEWVGGTTTATRGSVSVVVAAAALTEWQQLYQNFVLVASLHGNEMLSESQGWAALAANSDGSFKSVIRTSSFKNPNWSDDNPSVSAATADWHLDWIAVPI